MNSECCLLEFKSSTRSLRRIYRLCCVLEYVRGTQMWAFTVSPEGCEAAHLPGGARAAFGDDALCHTTPSYKRGVAGTVVREIPRGEPSASRHFCGVLLPPLAFRVNC